MNLRWIVELIYIDVDNAFGYGEPSESILTCPTVQNEPPLGYSRRIHCDDNDANRSPGLPWWRPVRTTLTRMMETTFWVQWI